jgi:hypothetical protein
MRIQAGTYKNLHSISTIEVKSDYMPISFFSFLFYACDKPTKWSVSLMSTYGQESTIEVVVSSTNITNRKVLHGLRYSVASVAKCILAFEGD